MIRVVVRRQDMAHVIHGGADGASVSFKTFDIEAPELERFLREERIGQYETRDVMGVELLPPETKPERSES